MECLIKDGKYENYMIECDQDKDVRLEFKVYEVSSWDTDGKPSELELFISGCIKWDGCSHIYFGDNDGYLHLCGHSYFEELKMVLDALWEKAEREIVKFNPKVAY